MPPLVSARPPVPPNASDESSRAVCTSFGATACESRRPGGGPALLAPPPSAASRTSAAATRWLHDTGGNLDRRAVACPSAVPYCAPAQIAIAAEPPATSAAAAVSHRRRASLAPLRPRLAAPDPARRTRWQAARMALEILRPAFARAELEVLAIRGRSLGLLLEVAARAADGRSVDDRCSRAPNRSPRSAGRSRWREGSPSSAPLPDRGHGPGAGSLIELQAPPSNII